MKPRRVMSSLEGKVVRKTRTESAGCPCGKVAYSSRKLAAAAAVAASKDSGEPIEAYHCTRGGHCFHIGHPIGWHAAQREAMAS